MRQIGNAVPVRLAKVMGDQMRLTLTAVGHERVRYKTDVSGNMLLLEKDKCSKRKQSGVALKRNSKHTGTRKSLKYPRHV